MNKLTGIVLCGGKSCRFGEDKGLCTLGGQLMIEYPLKTLTKLCDEIIISSNDERYSDLGYPVISDEIKNIGPLGGIYTALKHARNKDTMIVSCDMPFVTVELLRYIYDNSKNTMIASAFVKGYVEPLCSYFNTGTINYIEDMIAKGDYKLAHLLDKVDFKKININNNLEFYKDYLFLNVNTHTEYDRAQNILKRKNGNMLM